MGTINLNDVAKTVTLQEGLKKKLTIADVKEVLKVYNEIYGLEIIVEVWQKYNK